MSQVILLGGFIESIELCEKCGLEIVGIIDNTAVKEYEGYPVLGRDEEILAHSSAYHHIPLVMVPDGPGVRSRLYQLYSAEGFSFQTLISPTAIVSKSAEIGQGCIIQDYCNISARVKMGNFVRVNTFGNIMHESVIGDYTTIAPNAVVLGRCRIEELSYIGANATILPELCVGRNAVIGAGAVVTKNVDDNLTVAGNPARLLAAKQVM